MKRQVKEKYEQQGIAMTCRSFKEYRDMFALKKEDIESTPILDVASGASSFVRECNEQGYSAFSTDPLFSYSPEILKQHGLNEIEEATSKLEQAAHLYNWDYYGSLEHHRANRLQSLSKFTEDFNTYKGERYRVGTLPNLPFEDNEFSLILCSHFLFLYEEQFDLNFHFNALKELLRVCKKGGRIRIYPLMGFDGERYEKMQFLKEKLLEDDDISFEYIPTNLNFLKNASQILQLSKK